jgi:hypothetical protein
VKLTTRLEQCGYDESAEEFRDLVHQEFRQIFPDDTDETVLLHPRSKAIPFCEAVRLRVGLPLPDDLILGTLINRRKHFSRRSS